MVAVETEISCVDSLQRFLAQASAAVVDVEALHAVAVVKHLHLPVADAEILLAAVAVVAHQSVESSLRFLAHSKAAVVDAAFLLVTVDAAFLLVTVDAAFLLVTVVAEATD